MRRTSTALPLSARETERGGRASESVEGGRGRGPIREAAGRRRGGGRREGPRGCRRPLPVAISAQGHRGRPCAPLPSQLNLLCLCRAGVSRRGLSMHTVHLRRSAPQLRAPGSGPRRHYPSLLSRLSLSLAGGVCALRWCGSGPAGSRSHDGSNYSTNTIQPPGR